MAEHETFHHELSEREYAVLIDAQFQAAAAALSVDAFKNNVPDGAERPLYWDDQVQLRAVAVHQGEDNPGNRVLNRNFYRKVVRLLTDAHEEGTDVGFFQDTQLVRRVDGSISYEIFKKTTPQDLEGCPIVLDDLLQAIHTATNGYVKEATGDTAFSLYTPALQPA